MSVTMRVLPSTPAANADQDDGRFSTHAHAHAPTLARMMTGWDLDLFQLEAGLLDARSRQLKLADLTLSRIRANRALEFIGSSPRHQRTMVFLAERHQRLSWIGHPLTGNQLLMLPPRARFFAVTPANHEITVISLNEDLLIRTLTRNRQTPGLQAMREASPTVMEVPDLDRIRALVTGAARPASTHPWQDILASLTTAVPTPPRAPRRRDRALIRVHQLIQENVDDHLTAQDLCEAGQVSERTLQYAFAEHFGLTPMRYLVVHRLNRARNDLLRSGASQIKISEAAIRHGFWHMGSFAADYRKLFGELPSQTLRQLDQTRSTASHVYAHQDLGADEGIPLGGRGLQ